MVYASSDDCRGDPIRRIQYTPEEVQVWGTAITKLKALFPTHACREFNRSVGMFNFRWACWNLSNRNPVSHSLA